MPAIPADRETPGRRASRRPAVNRSDESCRFVAVPRGTSYSWTFGSK